MWFTNFLAVLGFELRDLHLQDKSLQLEQHLQPFWLLDCFAGRISCFLPRAGLRLRSSYLCLLSSWGHRCEPLVGITAWTAAHSLFVCVWNRISLVAPAILNSQSTCLSLKTAGITGMRHQAHLVETIFLHLLWFGSEMSPKAHVLKPWFSSAAGFRGGAPEDDWITRALTSSMA
jgi:hypothetical protein